MQWKQMKWPVFVDSFNLLDVSAVPITVLLDENHVIRAINPKPEELKSLLSQELPEPADAAPGPSPVTQEATDSFTVERQADVDRAITHMKGVLERSPKNGSAWFRLGVLYRQRYDSPARTSADFAKAVECWTTALRINPNQYIWRRRIQQYGPRLDKPYSFYDWVPTARKEIAARGEKPHLLNVEPSGAEFALPARADVTPRAATSVTHPDPNGHLTRDTKPLIHHQVVVVPSTDTKSEAYRVHVQVTTNNSEQAHWNNENQPPMLFLSDGSGWELSDRVVVAEQGSESATSTGPRCFEFELRAGNQKRVPRVTGSMFYYVCEGKLGTCQFLRKDIEIELP